MAPVRLRIFWQVFSRAGKQGLPWSNNGWSERCKRGLMDAAKADSDIEDEVDMRVPVCGHMLYRTVDDEP
jgi:hypothetical protein